MAGMGPAPKPAGQRRRRNATVAMTKLPAHGREGKPPKFPLELAKGKTGGETKVLRRLERTLWAELWATPQAAAWEQLGYTREVAQYVRWKVRGELGDLDAAKEARQLSDRLGLTPLAMLRLRWEIATDELGERRSEQEGDGDPAPAGRPRLQVVDPALVDAG